MNLWFVVHLSGAIVASVGPLPYGYQHCLDEIASVTASLDRSVTTEEGYSARDLKFTCELSDARPQVAALPPGRQR